MKGLSRVDVGLLMLRLALGAVFLYSGSQKMFGAFGGLGYSDQIDTFVRAGVPPLAAHLIVLTEFLGGLALVLGIFTPFFALALAVVAGHIVYRLLASVSLDRLLTSGDLAAASLLHPLVLVLLALAIAVMGAGKLSLDAKLFAGKGPKGK